METFLGIEYTTWWFLILGATVTGYAILDGFDMGVGAIHLFFKKEESRRIAINAIGPVWDGNEVWLVITGGVLFAAFPPVYATLFSGLYIPLMLFLVMIIFRAVSIEFRGKEKMAWWRKTWDISFSISSTIMAIALGMVIGNVLQGMPIGADGEFSRETDFSFVNPFSVLTGVTSLSLFMLHGALYLGMKTEGRLYARLTVIIKNTTIFFVLSLLHLTFYTLLYVPHLSEKLKEAEWLFILPACLVFLVANITRLVSKRKYKWAFASSSGVIASLLLLVAFELFPVMLFSSINPDYSLTLTNATASEKSLSIMLTIAMIAVPLIAIYTFFVFWTFRGKVKIDDHSY
ncbi:cytochrome bd-I ubiquinol oxidase subunit 2 apoprotein [Roseivirga ehrenbergii]|uniref:Cytochrome D oxidase subunit I n=1 Tax=Roseivirga ehrenbergii (strain DSM 102268 / JCM 13514 / KCTC 12282 / NCIMB 14502 / KMM 6017) TaxID=279360 RepID=A0A150X154_ROSEK|nr:cytochrome d ubiquinol oxidase subunit II [Roseivirga ehrenbergii]KYG72292.1 cytochrome D oxidase subunit I [Roseivirga ehrenbergii]TCL13536.1 cytochrome bd-I ubiquinol oxidase subunit 2 apoprotein [Roseivirga ehrenbergii]